MKQKSTHLEHEENIPYVSPYGLVLDYDAVYDRLAPDREDELHTTKRTLKCLTGFHMSIVRVHASYLGHRLTPYSHTRSGMLNSPPHSSKPTTKAPSVLIPT